MGGFQADEQMHMVGDSADRFRHTIHFANHAAEISLEPIALGGGHPRLAALRGEDHMVMQERRSKANPFFSPVE